MMLNYVKYGLSEEPPEKSVKQTPVSIATSQSTIKEQSIIQDHVEKKVYKKHYVWRNIAFLGTLHVIAVYGFFFRSEHFYGNVFAKIILLLSTLGTTGGAHRLWAHRTYKANFLAQCILMFMFTLTYQNSVYIWVRDHRLHHKYSETDADPHNAKRGFFFCHMGWLMVRKHPDVLEKGKTIDMSDLRANPIVMFQHRYYYPLVILIAVMFPSFFIHYVLGASWRFSILYATIYRYVVTVNLVWCINSMAHLYGTKPYDKNIGPTESGMMRICGLGEGFHNYHHSFPYDYKAAEFHNDARNLTTSMIDGFAWLGWVTDRKTVSKETIDAKVAKSGDGQRETFDSKKQIYTYIWMPIIFGLCLILG